MSYRLGATSFVYRANWQENVRRLAKRVQDIEILFFAADGRPDPTEMQALAALKRQHQLTYSLHTPLCASLASIDETRRQQGVQTILEAVASAAPLHPELYVVHVYLGDQEGDTPPRDLIAWRQRAQYSLQQLIDAGVPANKICVECLDYDFALIEPTLAALNLSVALDVGHLLRDGRDMQAVLLRNLPRVRAIQFHGTDPQSRDHRSVRHVPREQTAWLLKTLNALHYAGVLTLEVFNEDDFEDSMRVLQEFV